MQRSRQAIAITALSLLGITATAAHAATQTFPEWLEGVRAEARERGLKPATISSALDGLTPIPRVIELDRKQPEFTLTLQDYLSRVVNENRVKKGRRLLQENAALLKEVTSKYKVQPRFVVALWGIETDFGRLTGGFKVVPALATLAHDGRRSAYFRKELFNALKIIDQGHISADAMMGSWAGAMGQSQFMPSSFLNYAVDYNGDGRRDIWTTRADVFASAANYLASVGWRNDQTWGRQAKLPAGFDAAMIGLKTQKSLSEWQALGVRRADGTDLPKRDLTASLVKPSKSDPRVYLVYDNYRAVLRWNRSDYFATAVGTLSDRISRP
jgi:membrane-bound lytic murein transglycosylase B